MKLSEELIYRGFQAETTIENPADLDSRESKKFYWGADPSADSLTIGNLAALMMCACFVRHGYEPYLLVGGATGQIGDPKENSERDLKTLDEVEHNKKCIKTQLERVINAENVKMLVTEMQLMKTVMLIHGSVRHTIPAQTVQKIHSCRWMHFRILITGLILLQEKQM